MSVLCQTMHQLWEVLPYTLTACIWRPAFTVMEIIKSALKTSRAKSPTFINPFSTLSSRAEIIITSRSTQSLVHISFIAKDQ